MVPVKTFRDINGRTWSVAITVGVIRRVRDRMGINLGDPMAMVELGARLQVPCALVDRLWVLCEPQAQQAQVSEEAFGEALVGDAIEQAAEALLAAWIDFFPTPTRAVLTRALTAARRKVAVDLEAVNARLAEVEEATATKSP